ncbi:P-loop NTPase fold protein, partial [Streptomyces sp. NPDC002758]
GGPVRSVGWARDGDRLLLAAGSDDGVGVWEVQGAGPAQRLDVSFDGPGGPVRSVGWARDGDRLLLAAGSDDGVGVWEVERVRPAPVLPRYTSDASGTAADELDRTAEARAVAQLVTARSARPPLAVGLFGEWGEGKSHFLHLLREQARRVSSPLACRHVRDVNFNAWHYAETSLWASLVAEVFAQLAAPQDREGAEGAGTAQRQLSRLTADLVSRRRVRERLAAARQRRDELQRALARAAVPWGDLDEEARGRIAAAAGAELPAEALYREGVGAARVLRGTVLNARWVLRSASRRAWAWFALAVAASVAVPLGAAWAWPRIAPWFAAVPVLLAVGAVRSAGGRIRAAWQGLGEARARVRGLVESLHAPLRDAADVAAAEVAALESELQNLTAAGQLAGLVAERASTGDYRSRLGLMTQIREDFRHMADLLGRAPDTDLSSGAIPGPGGAPVRDEADDELPQIDRIIVYIDDLDRCPPARVVEMLEAIHLLLAVDLFVVVVAIDPRWLLSAVTAHYRNVLHAPGTDPANPDETWPATPAQYLEKIFQVVLTLPRMDADGYGRLLDSLITVQATTGTPPGTAASPAAEPAPSQPEPAAPSTPGTPAGTGTGRPIDGTDWDEDLYGPSVTLPVIEVTDPLSFTQDEARLLRLAGPPRLPLTPRSVKRLANSYGLMTAMRSLPNRERDLSDVPDPHAGPCEAGTYRPHRAGLVLLATLVAFPALGPDLCRHLHQQATSIPESRWADFLAGLGPVADPERPGGQRNAACCQLTPLQARQWADLHTALYDLTRTTADHGLALPDRLGPWLEWVVPAARLSFPAGQIVKNLDTPPRTPRQRVPSGPDIPQQA